MTELRGGHFYPLDVRRALDLYEHRAYLEACARRARAEPKSARRSADERARRALARRALDRALAESAEYGWPQASLKAQQEKAQRRTGSDGWRGAKLRKRRAARAPLASRLAPYSASEVKE